MKQHKVIMKDGKIKKRLWGNKLNLEKGKFGDKFAKWCQKRGREMPSQVMIDLLNKDEAEGREAIRNDPDHPKVYRALCSYLAGVGRG